MAADRRIFPEASRILGIHRRHFLALPMVYLFLCFLLLGLVLGVFVMLIGVERRPPRRAVATSTGPASREALMSASSAISARFHLTAVAPFATAFGGVGYLVTRYSTLGPVARLVIAAAAGALAAAGAIVTVARWAIPAARRDIPDERYLWQGLPAQVTSPIGATNAGRIIIEVDGTRHAVLAVSLTGDPIAEGSDVVIERIENGTAFVESWAAVERRL